MRIPFPKYQEEAGFLVGLLPGLAQLGSTIQGELTGERLQKGDRSPVTVADFSIQAVFARRLSLFDPQVQLVAEESSRDLARAADHGLMDSVVAAVASMERDATARIVSQWIDRGGAKPGGRFWTLDPIDGTKGFLRGAQWVVAAALIENGSVELAGLACPHLGTDGLPSAAGSGSLVLACSGGGSWARELADESAEFSTLKVSTRREPARARLLASVESQHTNHAQIAAIMNRLGSRAAEVRMDSQAKYAALAYGRAELLLRLPARAQPAYREKIWDQAAGALIVEQAGGMVTDIHGRRLDFGAGALLSNNEGIVASNGVLHPTVMGAVMAEIGDS